MTVAWGSAMEAAIHSWVVLGSGLPATKVVWGAQGGTRPAPPFIEMRCSVIRRVGQDWVDVVSAVSPSPGQEIEHRARGVRSGRLRLQCFGSEGRGDASPHAVLESVVASALLPSVRDALVAAKIGVAQWEPVVFIPGAQINGADFEPRALVEISLNLASEISELGTFVEFVDLEGVVTT